MIKKWINVRKFTHWLPAGRSDTRLYNILTFVWNNIATKTDCDINTAGTLNYKIANSHRYFDLRPARTVPSFVRYRALMGKRSVLCSPKYRMTICIEVCAFPNETVKHFSYSI